MVKVFVAGHRGLVGSSLVRKLEQKNYKNIIVRERKALDLCHREEVFSFFEKEKPEWVFLAAAKVGGIYANKTYPVDFLLDNLKIQNNVIEAAHQFGTGKLMFLASTCIYPKHCPQPMKEEYLLTSSLEPTNEPYAIAKITGLKLCQAFNNQYHTNFISVMPTNLFGPGDNYHSENAHVIPMLMRRFHEAKMKNEKAVHVWGTGEAFREFLYSEDLADACLFLMEKHQASTLGEFINVGSQKEISIRDLSYLIRKTVGLEAELLFDSTKPEGTPRKLTDCSRLFGLGWKPRISLEAGVVLAYDDFLKNPNTRL